MITTRRNIPRGIRNNNPLNIRIGNTWLGERPSQECTDHEFEQFVAMEYGLRAGFCILRRYIRHYHRTTIRAIITSWAPASENATDKYIEHVVQFTGIDADHPLDYADKPTMVALVQAMCRVECGQLIPLAKIEKGYDYA